MSLPKFLKRTRRPHYAPPTGAIIITRQHFKMMTHTTPDVSQVKQRYALATSQTFAAKAMDDFYTQALKAVMPSGTWVFGGSNGTATRLSFPDETALGGFFAAIDLAFRADVDKINDRWTYMSQLKAQAMSGQLKTRLDLNTQDEATYYTAPAPRAPVRGAPAIPAATSGMVLQRKATAFLEHGVDGDASAYGKMFRKMLKTDGTFPLGSSETQLRQAWTSLVLGAPSYRGWNNAAMQQRYPSDCGGRQLLNRLFADMATTTMPSKGNARWYDYALYLYGAIITAQPFTDGNKRMARLAYCLMLTSGQVPFKAPNATLGGQLAQMM